MRPNKLFKLFAVFGAKRKKPILAVTVNIEFQIQLFFQSLLQKKIVAVAKALRV
jgi:hypothetical protein